MSRSVMWSSRQRRVAPPGGNWPILPRPAALTRKTFLEGMPEGPVTQLDAAAAEKAWCRPWPCPPRPAGWRRPAR